MKIKKYLNISFFILIAVILVLAGLRLGNMFVNGEGKWLDYIDSLPKDFEKNGIFYFRITDLGLKIAGGFLIVYAFYLLNLLFKKHRAKKHYEYMESLNNDYIPESDDNNYLTPEEEKKLQYVEGLKVTDFEDVTSSAVAELERLVGLDSVKTELKQVISFMQAQNKRKDQGLEYTKITNHMVFSGNPGTGKTLVARLLARAFKEIGVLSRGHLVEVDRSNLIAEFVGQTGPKVKAVVETAMGGVLFIDEAYTLTNTENKDYGNEAIATLLKIMEDNREDIVIIAAGYTDLMDDFLNFNPGLKSRFNRFLSFPDYSAEELVEVFRYFCIKQGYVMTDSTKAKLLEHFEAKIAEEDANFPNARYVRNLFENTLIKQAARTQGVEDFGGFEKSTIEPDDIAINN